MVRERSISGVKKKPADYVKMKNNLNVLLKERGMTADELAQRTGLDPSSISLFRNMKGNISLGNIYEIMEVLNVSLGELFGEIPVNYRSIINIKYIENIDMYSNILEVEENRKQIAYGIDKNLLSVIVGARQTTDIIIATIGNNSMYDTVSTTDLIAIDLSHRTIDKNGLYLVLEQEHFEIRRILFDEERNEVNISLDNRKFMGNLGKNQKKEDAEKVVFGKVLRIMKKDNI
jgi:transcriptional regulator with XRE-family HTH domain